MHVEVRGAGPHRLDERLDLARLELLGRGGRKDVGGSEYAAHRAPFTEVWAMWMCAWVTGACMLE